MKLKDRPLQWWIGRSFAYWCRADINDTAKINYTLNWFSLSCESPWKMTRFSTDNRVNGQFLYQLQNGYIHDLKKVNGEWVVTVDYPFYNPKPTGKPKLIPFKDFFY